MRLDKFIANQKNISRKEAVNAIKKGIISINGETVKSPAFAFDPEKCTVLFGGEKVCYKPFVYYLINKPKGVLSASEDKNRETVVDLIPADLRRPGLFPVGRLDRDTTGLLIITDDGALAHNIISPKKHVKKSYIVTLDGNIKKGMCDAFSKGVTLADGTLCKPAELQILEDKKARVILFEGKYHQIKRMFGVFDLGVNELHRESIGDLYLPEYLQEGEIIELSYDKLLESVIKNRQNNR